MFQHAAAHRTQCAVGYRCPLQWRPRPHRTLLKSTGMQADRLRKELAKLPLMIAAAGAHNLLMLGPPRRARGHSICRPDQ